MTAFEHKYDDENKQRPFEEPLLTSNRNNLQSSAPGYEIIRSSSMDQHLGDIKVTHNYSKPKWLSRYDEIPTDVRRGYLHLQSDLRYSRIDAHRDLEKLFAWQRSLDEKTTQICLSGGSWEDDEFAENFGNTGEIAGSAAQGDEVFYVFFTVKESVLGIAVLELPLYITMPTMITLGLGQILPNVVQVDPGEFRNYIRPLQNVAYSSDPEVKAALKIKPASEISELEAKWLVWALTLKQEEEEGKRPKTCGDWLLKIFEYVVPMAITAGLLYTNTSSLSLVARGLLTAFTGMTTLVASYYDLVLPFVRFLNRWATPFSFWGCTFLGTIAQLDGINSLYSDPFPIGPASWSPWLKFATGLLGWVGIGLYALKGSKADARLKYAAAIIWAALFASWGAVELMVSANLFELTPGIRFGLQMGWLTFYVGPGGGSYYWLQVKDVTGKMQKIYFTKDSPIYQLFQINPLVAMEALVQYALNVMRRGTGMAAIPEVIAEWSEIPILVNAANWLEPAWLFMALHSTASTRTKAFDFALAPYQVELPDGNVILVNDKRLLKFQFDNDPHPADEMVKLSGCEKFWGFLKALVLYGIVAIGLYIYLRNINGAQSSAFETTIGFLALGVVMGAYSSMDKDHKAKTSLYIQNKIHNGKVPTYSKGAWALTGVTLASDGALRILSGANLNKRISFLNVFGPGKEKEGFVSMACFNAEPQVSETLFILERTLKATEKDIKASQKADAGLYHKGIGFFFGPKNVFVRGYEGARNCLR